MINQVRLLFKSVTGELNTVKAVWKIIYSAIGYVSFFYSSTVLLKEIAGYDKFEIWVKEYWQIVVVASLLISCIHNRKKINCCKKVQFNDMHIAISIKDIFSNRTANSFIIPTNTYFRTIMDDEYISPDSIQGRFQLKYFKKNVNDLNSLISDNLRKQRVKGENASDCFGQTMKYPIGTVAKIDYKKRHFYFVAINDVNEYGKPIGQSIENVNTALNAVTDAIKRIGHYDTLRIPLLGSGRAAIQEATKENVFQRTVDCFIQSNDKLVSKLIISVNPKDYLEGKIDLNRMEKYLDYKCEFRELAPSMSYNN